MIRMNAIKHSSHKSAIKQTDMASNGNKKQMQLPYWNEN